MSSKIEWTEDTWNPTTGCTRVSEGCDGCYAVAMTRRLDGMGQEKYQGLVNKGKKHFNGVVKTHEDVLLKPLSIKKPTTFFVNSMSDLFHESVPFDFIDKVFAVMALTPQHTYQVLTKRPERMAEYFTVGSTAILKRWVDVAELELKFPMSKCLWLWTQGSVPLSNVWLGTSVENQEQADKRIPFLLKCPAAVRFLSCEPILGPMDLTPHIHESICKRYGRCAFCDPQIGEPYEERIDWVIAGGESGPKARPMHPDWVRSLRDQCRAAGVPFFFKQWGEWAPSTDEDFPILPKFMVQKVGKKAAGRMLDGLEWNEMPV